MLTPKLCLYFLKVLVLLFSLSYLESVFLISNQVGLFFFFNTNTEDSTEIAFYKPN